MTDLIRRSAAFLRRRDSKLAQLVRYAAATGLSALLSVGLPIALHEGVGLSPEVAVAIGFVVVFVVNLLSVRSFVFSSGGTLVQDFLRFGVSSLVFRVLEYILFLGLLRGLNLNYVVAVVASLLLSSICKFFWYRRIMHAPERPAEAGVVQ